MGRKHHNRRKHKQPNSNETGNSTAHADPTTASALADEEELTSPHYGIHHSDTMGRYLVAKKRLAPGTVIMENISPLVVGPCQNTTHSSPVCLGCYSPIPQPHRCTGCNFPICGQDCSGLNNEFGHSPEECRMLSAVPPQQVDLLLDRIGNGTRLQKEEIYNPVVPLRCLLLKKNSPEKWCQLTKLEHHNQIRRNIPELWTANQRSVVEVILNHWQIKEFTEEEIHSVCGYLEVNAFSIGRQSLNLRALYGNNCSMMCHNCVPNTTHIDGDNYAMTVRTTTVVEKGKPITMTYASTIQGTMKRRKHLRESKFFDCTCERCSEPNELDTYMSAVRCGLCAASSSGRTAPSGSGYLLPEMPLDDGSIWKCTTPSCSLTMTSDQVIKLLNRVEIELGRIKGEKVDEFEEFLTKYDSILHPNHYLMIGAKYPLSQMYGKVDGYLIQELSQQQLKRKLDICRQLMALFDTVEPGLSRIRGVTLYEMHAPMLMLATSHYESGQINRQQLKSELRQVVCCLKESSKILSFEPPDSQEGSTAVAAQGALQAASQWQALIGKI